MELVQNETSVAEKKMASKNSGSENGILYSLYATKTYNFHNNMEKLGTVI